MKSRNAALWLTVFALAFFAMAASSPQCARTSETPLAPSLSTQAGGNGACSQACINDFQTAKKAEQARFKEAMASCNGDQTCQAEQSAIHDAIVGELVADKDACITDCSHQQGSGTSGQ